MFTPVTSSARHHGRDGRSPLLLAAALAVAVPGFLVSACSSHAGSGPVQNGPVQNGPVQNGAAQNGAAQNGAAQADGVTRASREVTGGRALVAAQQQAAVRAVRLMGQAAQAAILMSYQGEEVVTRWSGGSGSVLVANIWHASGGRTVTQTLNAGASVSSQPYLSSDTDGQAPEGVLGVTAPLVQLLESHYAMAYAGAGSAGNRTAQVVEAWRADGGLAARFWLDDATKLPLEREVFDSAAHVIGRDVFIDVSFANQGPTPAESAPAAPAHRPSRRACGPNPSRTLSCWPCVPAAGWSQPRCPAGFRCSPAPRRIGAPAPCSTSAIRTACR